MKKKLFMLLIGVTLACLMTGCGEKKATNKVVGATKSVGREVAADMKKAVEEFDTAIESEETEEATNEEVEDTVEVVEPEAVEEVDEFPAIESWASMQDSSDTYGVYSKSSYDLDQYLDDNGNIPGYEDYESSIYNEYSGRWAYPKFTPCKFFKDLTIIERTDSSELLRSVDFDSDIAMSIFVYSGLNIYKGTLEAVSSNAFDDYEIMLTTETVDGETTVIYNVTRGTYTIDGEESVEMVKNIYTFNVANFSVVIFTDAQLTEEDVQIIIDNIRPTNGLER